MMLILVSCNWHDLKMFEPTVGRIIYSRSDFLAIPFPCDSKFAVIIADYHTKIFREAIDS